MDVSHCRIPTQGQFIGAADPGLGIRLEYPGNPPIEDYYRAQQHLDSRARKAKLTLKLSNMKISNTDESARANGLLRPPVLLHRMNN